VLLAFALISSESYACLYPLDPDLPIFQPKHFSLNRDCDAWQLYTKKQ